MTNKTAVVLMLGVLGLALGGCIALDVLPVASFTLSPDAGQSPQTVTFDASSSHAQSGAIVDYVWDFGDGTSGRGMIVAHSYQVDEETTFTITLQVADHEGQVNSNTATLTIHASAEDIDEPSIRFVWPFHHDAAGDDETNLNDEYFTLRNIGSEPIDLSGWSVENEDGVTYRIPRGVQLAPGAVITIHSGSGVDTRNHLYWNASAPVWNSNSDLAILKDSQGEIVAYYAINSC